MFQYFRLECSFTERVLGTQPADPQARERLELQLKEDEEIIEVPEKLEVPRTTFYMKDEHPVIMNYQLKGWFKEVAATLPWLLGIPGRKREYPAPQTIKGYMDRWLFVNPRFIDFLDEGGSVKAAPDGILRHYVRGMTLRGQRVSVLDSDYMNPGTKFAFTVAVIEKCPITEAIIGDWMQYAEQFFLLQWRAAGFGTAKTLSLTEVAKETVTIT